MELEICNWNLYIVQAKEKLYQVPVQWKVPRIFLFIEYFETKKKDQVEMGSKIAFMRQNHNNQINMIGTWPHKVHICTFLAQSWLAFTLSYIFFPFWFWAHSNPTGRWFANFTVSIFIRDMYTPIYNILGN